MLRRGPQKMLTVTLKWTKLFVVKNVFGAYARGGGVYSFVKAKNEEKLINIFLFWLGQENTFSHFGGKVINYFHFDFLWWWFFKVKAKFRGEKYSFFNWLVSRWLVSLMYRVSKLVGGKSPWFAFFYNNQLLVQLRLLYSAATSLTNVIFTFAVISQSVPTLWPQDL